MKSLLVSIALLFACAIAQSQTALIAPTVAQVDPWIAVACSNTAPANYGATGIDSSGNLTGIASFQGFVCRLRVHAGRGPGIRIFSGCADVAWDQTGAIVLVTPTDADTTSTIVCQ